MPVGWILHILLLEILHNAPYVQFDMYSWNPGSLPLMVGRPRTWCTFWVAGAVVMDIRALKQSHVQSKHNRSNSNGKMNNKNEPKIDTRSQDGPNIFESLPNETFVSCSVPSLAPSPCGNLGTRPEAAVPAEAEVEARPQVAPSGNHSWLESPPKKWIVS